MELAYQEPFLLVFVYDTVASISFIGMLLPLVIEPSPTFRKTFTKPTVSKTLLVIVFSYRFVINGEGRTILTAVGALCMTSALASLYFIDLVLPEVGQPARRLSKVSTDVSNLLRGASVVNVCAALCVSVCIAGVALVHSSSLLAWVGIIGIYTFFASGLLRLTNDWIIVATAITCVGCLTMYTGMQLDAIMVSADLQGMFAVLPEFVQQLGLPLERRAIHVLVTVVRETLYNQIA